MEKRQQQWGQVESNIKTNQADAREMKDALLEKHANAAKSVADQSKAR